MRKTPIYKYERFTKRVGFLEDPKKVEILLLENYLIFFQLKDKNLLDLQEQAILSFQQPKQ